jgi:predicted metal-dependent enzyme (double-stranded beta helix superfamily)
MFGPVLPLLAERHRVVAVDLQGHGRTADIDRPMDVRLMAYDIAALRVIHAVANPGAGHSAGLHVYLGDLIAHDRTLWHPDTLQPMPFDNDKYFGLVREAKAAQASTRKDRSTATT